MNVLLTGLKNGGQWLARYYLLILLLFAGYRALNLGGRFHRGMIWSDAEGYYLYLRALFVHDDGFEGLDVRTTDQFFNYEGTNKRFTKYTCGVAMLEAPFFGIAHLLALASGRKADGYSDVYLYGLQAAGIFYGFLGLWLLHLSLLRHFKPGVAMMVVTGLFLGTNLYHYVLQEPGMSHVYSFFLFALWFWLAPGFYQKPGPWRSAGMGLLLGLITLIRPTNMLVLLFLGLYDVRSWQGFVVRLQFVVREARHLWLAPLAAALVFLPQLAYWKYLSGDWLIYSYGEEGFNWSAPEFWKVLFDIKNGWLLFSPMMALPLLGGFLGMWRNRYNMGVIMLMWLVTYYLTASWWCWWFGGAFGHRNFVEYYVFLAVPMAWLFSNVMGSRWWLPKIFLVAVWLVLLYYGYMLAVHFRGPHYEWYMWEEVVAYMWELRLDVRYE